MAVVRSPDFLRALIRETALATLIHQRRLTPSCGGHAPTAERTVGPARMIAESLTPKPGIREQNRQIKAYAMMAKTRWWAASDVPTMEEAGVPGLYASFWHGLWVPKGTAAQVIAKLNSAVRAALADAAVQQRFAEQGQEIPPPAQQTPQALGVHQKAEI